MRNRAKRPLPAVASSGLATGAGRKTGVAGAVGATRKGAGAVVSTGAATAAPGTADATNDGARGGELAAASGADWDGLTLAGVSAVGTGAASAMAVLASSINIFSTASAFMV